jgi:DNA replication initiation complex subunit (GINS family)
MGYRQDRLVVVTAPELALLTPEEKQLVDQVVNALRGKNAAELSAESHDEMGWRMVDFGETIPLETAYLAKTTPVTPQMREHARELAARHGLAH